MAAPTGASDGRPPGAEGLVKRHDYDVEIAGNTPGAHIIEDYAEVSGIKFPTKRRI